jgi:hypothetical protein
MTTIKEDADDGSDQTQYARNGRRGDGDGRGAARVRTADWARGAFYEKGSVRIRYEEAGSGFPLLLIAGGGLNSATAGLRTAPFNPMDEFKGEFRCIAADLRKIETVVRGGARAQKIHPSLRQTLAVSAAAIS